MHRRRDLYGDDAEDFRPERWGEGEKGQGLRSIGWGYLPYVINIAKVAFEPNSVPSFHGGPRICMGRKYLPLLSRPSELNDRKNHCLHILIY